MTLTVELTPAQEAQVRAAAKRKGVEPEVLVGKILSEHLPPLLQENAAKDAKERVRTLLAVWQAQDKTPALLPLPNENGTTPTEALFEQWEKEDAALTDEERTQEDELWQAFQQGIDAERRKAGMRTLF